MTNSAPRSLAFGKRPDTSWSTRRGEEILKGILLASLASLLIFAGMTCVFRTRPALPRARGSVCIWAVLTTTCAVFYWLVPADIGFLPAPLLGAPAWLDFLFALFVLSASFFGGWLQLYNLASRGYSLRILIDILYDPKGCTTALEVLRSYADGRGLNWMYDVRVKGLLQGAFISEDDDQIVLTGRGRRTARAFRILRAIYSLGDAGE